LANNDLKGKLPTGNQRKFNKKCSEVQFISLRLAKLPSLNIPRVGKKSHTVMLKENLVQQL
jgi:hypothetical protein